MNQTKSMFPKHLAILLWNPLPEQVVIFSNRISLGCSLGCEITGTGTKGLRPKRKAYLLDLIPNLTFYVSENNK